jgi:hypothetical protein
VLPQRLFQALALLVLLVCVSVFVGYALTGGEPFAWISATSGTPVLGVLCSLIAGLLMSLAFIAPLRGMSDMRPVREDFAELSVARVREEQAKLEAMRTGAPKDRRAYHLRMAAASLTGLLFGVPLVLATYQSIGKVFVFAVVATAYGVFGPPVHLAMAYWAGRER